VRKGRDVTLDLVGVGHIDWRGHYPERGRHGVDDAELTNPGRVGHIPNNRHPRDAWRDLLEQLQPFPAHGVFGNHEAGGINRIEAGRKHDRYGARRLQQRRHGRVAGGENHVRLERD